MVSGSTMASVSEEQNSIQIVYIEPGFFIEVEYRVSGDKARIAIEIEKNKGIIKKFLTDQGVESVLHDDSALKIFSKKLKDVLVAIVPSAKLVSVRILHDCGVFCFDDIQLGGVVYDPDYDTFE